MKAMSEPASLTSMTGIKGQMGSLMYMVGVSPVFKIELADEAAFWQLFDQAEKSSGFTHVAQQLNQIKYRQYRFSQETLTFDLLVTVQQGWATLTLSSDQLDAKHLALVLQAEKPEQSLANTSYLADIQHKYQLDQGAFAYISSAVNNSAKLWSAPMATGWRKTGTAWLVLSWAAHWQIGARTLVGQYCRHC